jgi:hypothetical protein
VSSVCRSVAVRYEPVLVCLLGQLDGHPASLRALNELSKGKERE